MALTLSILYRGPLSSCNYACGYCPFAKRRETRAQLAHDGQALRRFVGWVAARPADDRIGILFTPWGEALIRPWYREALIRLTNLPQVVRGAIQTNFSCQADWVEQCDKSKLAFWATYHPGEVSRSRFLSRCFDLISRRVRFSVGIVGLREHFFEIDALRRELPKEIYVWVNAYKDLQNYYYDEEVAWLSSIDPLFPVNNRRHPSRGRSCRAGKSVISVAGDGTVRRCHFIEEPLGNLYDPSFEQMLQERLCTNTACGCHIGYVHLDELDLYDVFGDGVLERIPRDLIWSKQRPGQACFEGVVGS
jgi:MoaA/NifB/PqqE/SkfB family radical SAM enzyme